MLRLTACLVLVAFGFGSMGHSLAGLAGRQPDQQFLQELAAARARLSSNWKAPAGMKTLIEVQFLLNRDGTLAAEPKVLTGGEGESFEAAANSVKQAVIRSAPFNMFRVENYEKWKNLEVNFDPAYTETTYNFPPLAEQVRALREKFFLGGGR